ncbi:MAG: lysozyme inhibitor LprI family protein [Clostridium sp.]|uniref:lysozyme inhibitor LprI family protein n=1 Tax=Clostridium sp. TaxID=1506 RepID=UPI003F2B42EE
MNKKIISAIIGIIVLVIIICSFSFFFIHKKDEALQKQKLEQQQKQEQQIKAEQAKAKELTTKKNQEAKEESSQKQVKEQPTKSTTSNIQTTEVTQTTKPTQTDKNQMDNLNATKTQFLNEMANIKYPKLLPGERIGIVTLDASRYQMWNKELNKIWGVLRDNLPQSEMASLTKDEQNWIQQKSQYDTGYRAGNQEATKALYQMTKERCYYLVNNYM